MGRWRWLLVPIGWAALCMCPAVDSPIGRSLLKLLTVCGFMCAVCRNRLLILGEPLPDIGETAGRELGEPSRAAGSNRLLGYCMRTLWRY